MTERLTISKDKDAIFRNTCDYCKVPYQIVGEGQDGDTYEVTFNYCSDLFYLGRCLEIDVAIIASKERQEKYKKIF